MDGRFLAGALCITLASIGCGDSTPQMLPDGGYPDATVSGDPVIVSFEAAHPDIPPFGTTALTWKVMNARIVDVSSQEGTLVSTFADEGTVVTSALRATTDFVLTASGNGKSVTQTLTVHVSWPAPQIDSFAAIPNPGFIGQFVTLQWVTENADRVRILRDGNEISRFSQPPAQTSNFANIVIAAEREVYTLEASNPDQAVTQEIILEASVPPQITRFVVTPRVALGASVTATISWTAVGVDSTQLQVSNMSSVPWPGTVTGTITLELTAPVFLQLFGFSRNGTTEADRFIQSPQFEQEPDDDFNTPNDLSGTFGAIGSIASRGDVDVYRIFFMSGFVNLRVVTTSQDGGGCSTDTVLVLRGPDFAELGRKSGGGQPTGRGGECAVIDPRVDAFARGLTQGTAFIEVQGERGETGSYAVLTDEL